MVKRGRGSNKPTPFVKWAGGKGQLLAQFEALFPADFDGYIEPFAGGGAVFFHLYNHGRLNGRATLSDSCWELMNCYRVIRDEVEALIAQLKRHELHRLSEEYFYEVRSWDRRPDFARRSAVERAARTIFLNRTCYNGLYRVNSRGQFNVPHGRYRNPVVCDEANLRAVSRALQGVELRDEGFERCVEWARPGDFVYLDPPYHPLSSTASFTAYTHDSFGPQDQERLAAVFRRLDARGCRVMLSNSRTPFVCELYAGYRQKIVTARRPINSRASGRGEIEEIVVLNW